MASLQNEQIDQSYQGLIKTADNTAAKPFPPVKLQYGDGTDTPIAIGEGPAGSGLGDMIEITSGTGTNTGILVNGQGVVVNDLNNISPNANGLTIANGATATTISFGFPFPGAPVTTVDFSAATVTGLPSSGGGAEANEGQAITPAMNTNAYSIPWVLSGYGQGSAKTMNANDVYFIPFYAAAGETIDEFYVRVQSAQPGATMNIGLYKAYAGDISGNKYTMPEYVGDIATGVDVSSTGKKSFTGLNITLPSDAVGGCYWIGFQSDTANVALTKWNNWVAAERIIFNDIYRGNGVEKYNATFALPTGQVDLSSQVSGSTDLPVDFAWRYKS